MFRAAHILDFRTLKKNVHYYVNPSIILTNTDCIGKSVNNFNLPHTVAVAVYHTDLFDSPAPSSLHSNVCSSETEF